MLLQAADAGSHIAAGYVSVLHAVGYTYISKDDNKALMYMSNAVSGLQKHAVEGCAYAEFLLGEAEVLNRTYLNRCVYMLSASQGLANAQNCLDQKRVGVTLNYQEALRYYRLAADQGNIIAVSHLDTEWPQTRGTRLASTTWVFAMPLVTV